MYSLARDLEYFYYSIFFIIGLIFFLILLVIFKLIKNRFKRKSVIDNIKDAAAYKIKSLTMTDGVTYMTVYDEETKTEKEIAISNSWKITKGTEVGSVILIIEK